MADPKDGGRTSNGPFTLPSIATMTKDMHKPDTSPNQRADMMRDSGMWSMQSPSKHSSTISSATGLSTASSNTGLQLHTILNSDDSHRFSATSSSTPPSTRFSRDTPSSHPHYSQAYEPNNRASIDANNTSFLDSRRSSIDSRVNVNIGHLSAHSVQSPYESNNASQSSLPLSTHSQQRPTMGPPTSRPATSGVVPRRPVTAGGQPPRRAPPITPNPRSGSGPNPLAATPTKGFAWAFPDEKDDADDAMISDSSRHGSLAASSVNTLQSEPWVKHESSYEPHGPLQHRSISNLQAANSLSSGNYSRTPELRVSHKLAERKRRSEMKDLFEELNRKLPNPPGNKASKWEVLSKAVEYINHLKNACDGTARDADKLRVELDRAKAAADENHMLQQEINAMHQQLHRVDPNGTHIFGPRTHQLENQQSSTPGGRIPPMHSGYGAMQGVEYGHGYDRR